MQIEVKEITDVVKKYAPQHLIGVGIAGLMWDHMTSKRQLSTLAACYGTASVQYQSYKHKVERRSHSNNWLKMHGQPLRRGKENKRVF